MAQRKLLSVMSALVRRVRGGGWRRRRRRRGWRRTVTLLLVQWMMRSEVEESQQVR